MSENKNQEVLKTITCKVSKDSWIDLRIIAATQGLAMGDIIKDCVSKYIKSNKDKLRKSSE